MTAKSGTDNERASSAEKIDEAPSEANIEMTDTGKDEAVEGENVNVEKSQANGEINPPEDELVKMEEDQVIRKGCLVCPNCLNTFCGALKHILREKDF